MNPDLNIWESSKGLLELVYARGLDRAPEMDCAAQGAELLRPFIGLNKPRLIDVGCGGGHLRHSLNRRGLSVEYYGLDVSPKIVAAARRAFSELGLDPKRIILGAAEDLSGAPFDIAAVINFLTFRPDFREPLDRLCDLGVRAMVIRDNFGPKTEILWERDGFLDEGRNHLRGYWNRWETGEVRSFLESRGFYVREVEDLRTKGGVETVVGKPYYWSWLVASRPGI
jgi:SAM-dependent methyltransferase